MIGSKFRTQVKPCVRSYPFAHIGAPIKWTRALGGQPGVTPNLVTDEVYERRSNRNRIV